MELSDENWDAVIKRGYTKIAVELIQDGRVDVNYRDIRGRTALHKATVMGCTDIVKALLEHGANADIQNDLGETALHCAAEHEQVEIIELLLNKNPELVNKKNICGNTALHWAAYSGNVKTVKKLVEFGADANIKNTAGRMAEDMIWDPNIRTLLRNADKIRANYLKKNSVVAKHQKVSKFDENRQYE